MAHEVIIIETKEINDEQVAYRTVCCGLQCSLRGGDPALGCTPDSHKCHDNWFTATVGDDHQQALQDHMQAVADKHEKKFQWKKDVDKHASNVLSVSDTGEATFTNTTVTDTI